MKKLLAVITLFLLFFGKANAQITEGNWMVGGNASFNHSKYESFGDFPSKSKSSGMQLNANLGYFVINNFAVGVSPYFGFSNLEGSNNSHTSYGIGPFVRYYFLPSDKMINVFSQAGYRYGITYAQGKKASTNNDFDIKAGAVVFFNSSVALEFTAEYHIDKGKAINNNSSHQFNYFVLGLGFQIHLEK